MLAATERVPSRIVLIGFMGAGKSTVGPVLADRLGWHFFDSDHAIQERSGTAIAETFLSLGEAAFRELEESVVSELLEEKHAVLALGGGAIESKLTRSLILSETSETYTVFLQAPLEIMVDRCERQSDAAVRPVLSRRDLLADRFSSRLPHYQKAHLTVGTAGKSPAEVAEQILRQMLENSCLFPDIQKAIPS